VRDKKFNLYNNGGAMVGHEKCLLIDSDGAQYRVVMRSDEMVDFLPSNYYSGAHIGIRYLAKSRIVLHMKAMSSDNAAKHLRKDFYEYFT
jgi:hypothetical protein